MSSYPATKGLTPFADARGHLDALDGCAPAARGKRAAARLIDTALIVVIGLIAYLPALVTSFGARTYSEQQAATGLTLFGQVVCAAASLGYLLMLCLTGYLPGGRILGVRQVNIMGRAPGFAGVGKYALEALLSVFTCNIGLLISFAVIKPPLNRAWYDAATGIVVLDVKAGRDPLAIPSTTVAVPTEPAEVRREAVVSVGSATHGVTAPAAADETSLVSPLSAPPAPHSVVQRPMRSSPPAVVSVEDDGMIVGVPWRKGEPSAAPATTDFMPVLDIVRVPVSSPDIDLEDRTVVSREAIAGVPRRGTLALVSDDGQRIPLDKVTVVGRNPSTPDGYSDARIHPLLDTTMSVSKTHVILGPDPDGVWVQDLRSTNGTAITTANGMRTAVPAGGRVVAGLGALVHIGKVAFKVTEQ